MERIFSRSLAAAAAAFFHPSSWQSFWGWTMHEHLNKPANHTRALFSMYNINLITLYWRIISISLRAIAKITFTKVVTVCQRRRGHTERISDSYLKFKPTENFLQLPIVLFSPFVLLSCFCHHFFSHRFEYIAFRWVSECEKKERRRESEEKSADETDKTDFPVMVNDIPLNCTM